MKMCGGKPPAPLSAHAPIKANQLIDLAFIQMRPTMTHASLECKRFFFLNLNIPIGQPRADWPLIGRPQIEFSNFLKISLIEFF